MRITAIFEYETQKDQMECVKKANECINYLRELNVKYKTGNNDSAIVVQTEMIPNEDIQNKS